MRHTVPSRKRSLSDNAFGQWDWSVTDTFEAYDVSPRQQPLSIHPKMSRDIRQAFDRLGYAEHI